AGHPIWTHRGARRPAAGVPASRPDRADAVGRLQRPRLEAAQRGRARAAHERCGSATAPALRDPASAGVGPGVAAAGGRLEPIRLGGGGEPRAVRWRPEQQRRLAGAADPGRTDGAVPALGGPLVRPKRALAGRPLAAAIRRTVPRDALIRDAVHYTVHYTVRRRTDALLVDRVPDGPGDLVLQGADRLAPSGAGGASNRARVANRGRVRSHVALRVHCGRTHGRPDVTSRPGHPWLRTVCSTCAWTSPGSAASPMTRWPAIANCYGSSASVCRSVCGGVCLLGLIQARLGVSS